MRPRLLLPALLASLWILASCRTTGPPALPLPDGFPDHSAETIIERLPTADSLWRQFRVEAALAFATPVESGSFSAHILVRRPDSVLVRIRAPLGIEVARALITADSLLVYDRVQKTLFAGPADSDLLPAGLKARDLAAAFFGFDRPEHDGWTAEADSLVYRLERDRGAEDLLVDPRTWRILARDVRDAAGGVVERRRFSEFDRFGGILLPRRIVTIRPVDGTRGSFFVRKVDPDPADTSMDLGVRDDARRVPIR